MITRFAPSPTGYLHLGHAFAASQAFSAAKGPVASCLLRIEDIDTTRCKPDYTDAIYEDLAWLGFTWPKPVRMQSEHGRDYAEALEAMKSPGLIYPCFLSRREILNFEAPYVNPDPQNNLKTAAAKIACGEIPAWRLSMQAAAAHLGEAFDTLTYNENGKSVPANAAQYGDVVIARKDIGTSYHLACTHDDALQGITHIVRGKDLSDMTGLHRLIQALMEWPAPEYCHHDLVMKDETDKLSKRSGDTAVRQLRAGGYTPAQVLDMAASAVLAIS